MEAEAGKTDNLDLAYARLVDAFQNAAEVVLPEKGAKANRPWTSKRTLDLINERTAARKGNDFPEEQRLAREIKKSVAQDRAAWLDDLLATGNWDEVRKLKKGLKQQQGRLKNVEGKLVSSEERAETLAQHLEKVQWAVRPTSVAYLASTPIYSELQMNVGAISLQEVFTAVKALKAKRAPGLDQVPAEFWKAIVQPGSLALQWAIDFCNLCWQQKNGSRRMAQVKGSNAVQER